MGDCRSKAKRSTPLVADAAIPPSTLRFLDLALFLQHLPNILPTLLHLNLIIHNLPHPTTCQLIISLSPAAGTELTGTAHHDAKTSLDSPFPGHSHSPASCTHQSCIPPQSYIYTYLAPSSPDLAVQTCHHPNAHWIGFA